MHPIFQPQSRIILLLILFAFFPPTLFGSDSLGASSEEGVPVSSVTDRFGSPTASAASETFGSKVKTGKANPGRFLPPEPTPANLRELIPGFSAQDLPTLEKGFVSPDPRTREEALFIMGSLPHLPEMDEPRIVEGIIDRFQDASESVRIQALKTLLGQFSELPRTHEIVASLSAERLPANLVAWAKDVIETGGRRTAQAEAEIRRLTEEADRKMRDLTLTLSRVDSASATKAWLQGEPTVKTVDLTGDCLWFTTKDGLQSGLLLDTYPAFPASDTRKR